MEKIIIAIIVGIIGYFVKRKSEEQERKNNTPRRPVMTPNKPASSNDQSNKQVVSKQKSTIERHQPKAAEIKGKVEKIVIEDHKIDELNKEDTPIMLEKESPKRLSINEDDLLKGIILSEVLGPPRAKRPFKSRS
ncbi:hypothetical protein J6TS2_18260 [Heyndrickxia sporothermodurans]|nr:hypothetical protein J6TS2_18260 [Heyndrickxia sporothermodurans]